MEQTKIPLKMSGAIIAAKILTAGFVSIFK